METSSTNTPAQSDGSIQDVSQQSTGGNIGQSSVSSQPPSHTHSQGKILYPILSRNLHKYPITQISIIIKRYYLCTKRNKKDIYI